MLTVEERKRALDLADVIAADLGMKELLPEHVIRTIGQGIHAAVDEQRKKDAKVVDEIGHTLDYEQAAAIIRAGGD